MKVSDYIVDFLISKGISDIFGYPGGMVTHLLDSLGKRSSEINTHILYHEQSASFAACGYAEAARKIGVVFATSGPGATNLVTGIANAYYDSIPVIFITGQVNSFEAKGNMPIRQRGFQETDIVPIVSSITKKAYYIDEASSIIDILDEAYSIATSDRKGPVLLDIPMDIFRTEIRSDIKEKTVPSEEKSIKRYSQLINDFESCLTNELHNSKRPCMIIGNGVRIADQVFDIRGIIRNSRIPVVSSILAVDIIPEAQGLEGFYYGFIGAYGNRTANFVVAKSDLVICIGTRLDVRQVGKDRSNFAPDAKIIRIDIDPNELDNKIRDDDYSFCINVKDAIPIIRKVFANNLNTYEEWLNVCKTIKNHIKYTDEREPNKKINMISKVVPDGYSIVSDVGQHMIWVAQSFKMKADQRIYFSGGLGAMGYALPASIGIYYATKRAVICFIGDGGFQMNIQELQFISANHLPIKIVVVNNNALGMIRHFQEMYFDSNYYFTVESEGYSVPDFVRVAKAYGIKAKKISETGIPEEDFEQEDPILYELKLKGNTYLYPKLEYGKPNQDQEPLLDRSLYNYLMGL